MSEHYPKSTTECEAYCTKCEKLTRHRVDDGRKGPCLACLAKLDSKIAETGGWSKAQLKRRKAQAKKDENPTLF